MVDTLVELVLDPGTGIPPGQKIDRAHDQVVEVEAAARAFQPFVDRDEPLRQDERRMGGLQHAPQRQPVHGLGDAERASVERIGKPGMDIRNALGGNAARGAGLPLPLLAGQEGRTQDLELVFGIFGLET